MIIAIGSDGEHHLTRHISEYLEGKGHTLVRCGALTGKAADYVDSGREVAEAVAGGACDQGVLFCNTGTGASIVANKVFGARAALCVDAFAARIARLANNANILVLSLRITGEGLAREIVDAWLETEPSTEERRRNFHRKIDELDAAYRSPRS